jgi:hypothetical protein
VTVAKPACWAGAGLPSRCRAFAHFGQAARILQMLMRFFLHVFRKKRDPVRALQNIYLHALLPQLLLIAGKVRNVADHQPLELKLIMPRDIGSEE